MSSVPMNRSPVVHVNQLGALYLGPRSSFGWEGWPTKIDYRQKGTLVLSSLLDDLDTVSKKLRMEPCGQRLSCCQDDPLSGLGTSGKAVEECAVAS